MLSGGAGRVITAIPALEKFHRLNPKDNFKVITHGWENLYWNHPLLQSKTFNIEQKGIFDQVIKNSRLKVPEPYHLYTYYNQFVSLAEAFDEEINNTTDHSDLEKPSLFCGTDEVLSVKKIVQDFKNERKKDRFVVFQPYGSSAQFIGDTVHDPSGRSLEPEAVSKLGSLLAQEAVVLYFGPPDFFNLKDDFLSNVFNIQHADLRLFMAAISECDYFVGVDSVGQHMARAFNKPGMVIMGSTLEKNVTYPSFFKIYRNGKQPTYSPIRLGNFDCSLADRSNNDIMKFSDDQLEEIYSIAKKLA